MGIGISSHCLFLFEHCFCSDICNNLNNNLNYTTCSEALQRPQSLPRGTGKLLSPTPFSLQISALLLGARQQSKEDIVLFNTIPGTASQQQRGDLGEERHSLECFSSCMGHSARGCTAAAGRDSRLPSRLLGLPALTDLSLIL